MTNIIIFVLGLLLGIGLGFAIRSAISLKNTNHIGTLYMTKSEEGIDVYLEFDSTESLNESYNSEFVTAKVKKLSPSSH